jgi:hypothetical protein
VPCCQALYPFDLCIGNANDHSLAKRSSSPSNSIQRHRNILRIEKPIQLRSAGVKLPCHRSLRLLLFPHGLFHLPRQYPLDGNRFDLFANAFLFKEAIEA